MTYLLLDSQPTLYCQANHGKLLNFFQGNIFVAKATIIYSGCSLMWDPILKIFWHVYDRCTLDMLCDEWSCDLPALKELKLIIYCCYPKNTNTENTSGPTILEYSNNSIKCTIY